MAFRTAIPWEVAGPSLQSACDPLSLVEVANAVTLLASLPADASQGDKLDVVATILNQQPRRQGRQLTRLHLEGALQRVQGRLLEGRVLQAGLPSLVLLALALASRQRAEAQLAEHGMLYAAAPAVAECQSCKADGVTSELELLVHRRGAWFYQEARPPATGTVYYKRCRRCGAQHHLDGWQHAAVAGAPAPHRYVYSSADMECPNYEPATRERVETLIEKRMLRRRAFNLQFMQGSFQAETEIYNNMEGLATRFTTGEPAAGAAAGGAQRTERAKLYRVRLTTAFFSFFSRIIARACSGDCMEGINVMNPVDVTLLQVLEPMRDYLKERFHFHKARAAELDGRQRAHPLCPWVSGTDGNQVVTRDHCREEIDAPSEGYQVHLRYSNKHYCPETPGRSCAGFCKRHWNALSTEQQQRFKEEEARRRQRHARRGHSTASEAAEEEGAAEEEEAREGSDATPAAAAAAALPLRTSTRYSDRTPVDIVETREWDKVLFCKVVWEGIDRNKATWMQWTRLQGQHGAAADALLQSFRQSQLPSTFYEEKREREFERHPDVPELEEEGAGSEDGEETEDEYSSPDEERRPPGRSCRPRLGAGNPCRSCGTLWTRCICGYPAPPSDLLASESCQSVHQHWMYLWQGHGWPEVKGIRQVQLWDTGCHMLSFSRNPARLAEASPLARELAEKVDIAVDAFHFRGHKSRYCAKYANPHKVPLLRDNPTNQSVLEQGFRQLNRHSYAFRYMNRARYNFLLLFICWMEQNSRDKVII